MIVRYRIIKYEAQTQEAMDHQIGNSLAEGIYSHSPHLKMSVKNHEPTGSYDPLVLDDEFWKDLPKRPDGCITNNQLRQKHLEGK